MKRSFLMTVMMSLFVLSGLAQNNDASNLTKQANNPLASIKSVSVHNVLTPTLYGTDGSLNTTWLRYAQPIKKVLIRASMPINSYSFGDQDKSGLGDFNVFGTYIITETTAFNQIGVGPILTIPTATSSLLGSGKWQIGAALAGYFAKNHIIQFGLLATWQHSFAGDDDRCKVHVATIQPFVMWQLGRGMYMRSSGISVFDFGNKQHYIPFGVGLGKIVQIDKVICNIFAEPQFTVWHKSIGAPKTLLFVGINTQF